MKREERCQGTGDVGGKKRSPTNAERGGCNAVQGLEKVLCWDVSEGRTQHQIAELERGRGG